MPIVNVKTGRGLPCCLFILRGDSGLASVIGNLSDCTANILKEGR